MNHLKPISLLGALMLAASACSSGSDVSASVEATDAPTTTISTTTEAPTSTVATTATDAPTTTSTEVAGASCQDVSIGLDSYRLNAGGADHPINAFVPSSYDPSVPLPLVLDFHGLGSNGGEQILLSLYETLAEEEGFIVIHPTGAPSPLDGRLTWELMQFDFPELDDLAFANALIDDALERYCVDETRVYSTGMSNGSLFTSRLICEMGDRIAAASSIAGVTHAEGCEPSRAVPYIAFHGTDDEVVPFDGSVSDSSLEGDFGGDSGDFFSQIMSEEFAEFAADAGCDLEPSQESLSDEVTVYDYSGCQDGIEMSFYEIEGGGHTWPGSPLGIFLEDSLGRTTLDIDATKLSWDFFKQYSL